MRMILAALVLAIPSLGQAQDNGFTLSAPTVLIDTGFLRHLTPRFSLKTQVRITVVPQGTPAEVTLGSAGTPVFRDAMKVWHLSASDNAGVARFLKWLQSDIGQRTIAAFAPDGSPMFSADFATATAPTKVILDRDAARGETLSLRLCGRCHVVSDKNRMNGMGSSPSFRLLRGFDDWQGRFAGFFGLKPHPAFTQVDDVTDPFPAHLPSPISPIILNLDDLDAIMAYVQGMAPADLGAPLQTQ